MNDIQMNARIRQLETEAANFRAEAELDWKLAETYLYEKNARKVITHVKMADSREQQARKYDDRARMMQLGKCPEPCLNRAVCDPENCSAESERESLKLHPLPDMDAPGC